MTPEGRGGPPLSVARYSAETTAENRGSETGGYWDATPKRLPLRSQLRLTASAHPRVDRLRRRDAGMADKLGGDRHA